MNNFHEKLYQLNCKHKQDVNFLIKNTIDSNLSLTLQILGSLSKLHIESARQQRNFHILNTIVRSINKDLNDRISILWNARDEKVKLSFAMSVYRDLMEFWGCLSSFQLRNVNPITAPSSSSSLLSATKPMLLNPSARIFYALRQQFCTISFPSFKQRIEFYLSHIIQKQWTIILTHRYTTYRHEFMELTSIQRVYHTVEDLLPCTATSAMLRHVHEDQSISTLCQRYLADAFLHAYETVQPPTGQHATYYRHLVVVMYSTMLTLWLSHILTNMMYFDESGVYTFYRILLQVQEQIQHLKHALQVPEQECFWEEEEEEQQKKKKKKRLWHRLQIILHILNLTVFQYKEGNTAAAAAAVSRKNTKSRVKTHPPAGTAGTAGTAAIAPILTDIPSSSSLAPMTPAILSPSQIIPFHSTGSTSARTTIPSPNSTSVATIYPDTETALDVTKKQLVASVVQHMPGYSTEQILEMMSEDEQMRWRGLVIHPHGVRHQDTAVNNPVLRVLRMASTLLTVPWMKVLRKKNHGTIFAQLELNYQHDL